MNNLANMNSFDLAEEFINKDELIMTTILKNYEVREYNVADIQYPNSIIFMLMKYKYVANEKYSIILEFYSAYIEENTIKKRLIKQELFLYNYKDTYDYSKYYDYVKKNSNAGDFFNKENVIYKQRQINPDLSEVFTIIFNEKEDSERNKYIVIEKYKVKHEPSFKMTNIAFMELEEDIPHEYYNLIKTLLQKHDNKVNICSIYRESTKSLKFLYGLENINMDKYMYFSVRLRNNTKKLIIIDKTNNDIVQIN